MQRLRAAVPGGQALDLGTIAPLLRAANSLTLRQQPETGDLPADDGNGAPAEPTEVRPAAKGRTPPANGQGGRGRSVPSAPPRGKQPSQKRK